MQKEPLVSVNISKSQTLLFYEDFLVYKGNRINYNEIQGISYLWTKTTTSVYFVPVNTSSKYSIEIETHGRVYDIDFSSGFLNFGQGEKEREELFAKIVHILDVVIKPFVITNLLLKYVQNGELFISDSLTINPTGLYKKRLWRSPDFLAWRDYYNSTLFQGNVHIYKDDARKKYAPYFACSMSVMNAVVMPDLLNFLFQNNGTISQSTIKELKNRKNTFENTPKKEVVSEGGFCPSCSAPKEELNQKFCTHCGGKL